MEKCPGGKSLLDNCPGGTFMKHNFTGGVGGGGLIVQRGLLRGNCPRGKYLGGSRPKGELHRG